MSDTNPGINTRQSTRSQLKTTSSSGIKSNLTNTPPAGNAGSFDEWENRIINSVKDMLDSKFEIFMNSLLAEFTSKLDSLVSRINLLSTKIDKLEAVQSSFDDQLMDVKRHDRSCDLVIRGIPYSSNENTLNVFKQLADSINFTSSPYTRAFRSIRATTHSSAASSSSSYVSGANSKSHSNHGPIIVKLSCSAERDAFFSVLRKRKLPLTLRDLNCGFSSDSRISIFESLLPADDNIRRAALHMRKEKLLRSIHIKRGAVYVLSNAGQMTKISSIDQLNSFSSAASNK